MKEAQDILSSISQRNLAPVYLLMGEEPFFIDQITDRLIEQVVEESAKDFDLTILYGKETHPDQILEAAKRFPMLGEQQLIVVKEAQYLEKNIDLLTPYLAQPQRQTVLVLCFKHKKLDKRKKAYKAIAKTGVVLASKPLYENQVGPWIEAQGKAMGLGFHPRSLAQLVTFLGSDLGKIKQELIKLSHNLSAGEEVTPDHIEQYIGFSKEFNSFELQNALGQRNLAQAYRIVHYMAANAKQHPFQLTLAVIFNFYQKLFIYHGLKSPAEAPRALGVSPYFIKDYTAADQKYSMKQTAKVLGVLKTFDLKSKGLGADKLPLEELLKEMILTIISV